MALLYPVVISCSVILSLIAGDCFTGPTIHGSGCHTQFRYGRLHVIRFYARNGYCRPLQGDRSGLQAQGSEFESRRGCQNRQALSQACRFYFFLKICYKSSRSRGPYASSTAEAWGISEIARASDWLSSVSKRGRVSANSV